MHLFKHNLLLKHIKRFGKKKTTKISLALIIKMFIHKSRKSCWLSSRVEMFVIVAYMFYDNIYQNALMLENIYGFLTSNNTKLKTCDNTIGIEDWND